MINKVILIGNVGADPVVRYLEGGVPVANFRLATTEIYKNKHGERVEQTEWHNIVLWRGLAQVAENFVKKGTQLYVEGRIRSRSWEDQNKITHNITEIYADVMQILARRKDVAPGYPPTETTPPAGGTSNGEVPAPSSPSSTDPVATAAAENDDLPF
jgi:single-strand DNA-binding protein